MAKASFLALPVIQQAFGLARQAGGEGRLVGGVVRDWLIGRPLGDFDMAVSVPITRFAETAQAAGLRVIPTGLAHGSVTVHHQGVALEVTQTRADIDTDGRHATIGFTPSFEDDAKRRDFTMNALYLDEAGMLHDPLGGRADIAAGKIRFIGSAKQRISEDYLRILRYFRFAAQLRDFALDEASLGIIAEGLSGLHHVSGERIATECRKIFGGENWPNIIPLMTQAGVAGALFGGAFYHPLADHDRLKGWQAVAASCLTPQAQGRFLDLPLSRADRAMLTRLLTPFEASEFAALQTDSWREMVHFGGADFAQRCLVQNRHHNVSISDKRWDELENFIPPPCPVTGHDLQQAGVPAGPAMGAMLRRAEQLYIRSDYQRNAADIIAELTRLITDE